MGKLTSGFSSTRSSRMAHHHPIFASISRLVITCCLFIDITSSAQTSDYVSLTATIPNKGAYVETLILNCSITSKFTNSSSDLTIISLTLTRKGDSDTEIASITPGHPVYRANLTKTVLDGLVTRIQGRIQRQRKQGFLTVTMQNHNHQSAGVYDCTLTEYDVTGHTHKHVASVHEQEPPPTPPPDGYFISQVSSLSHADANKKCKEMGRGSLVNI